MANLRILPRFRLEVTECSMLKSRKPKVDHYDYTSLFDLVEAFLLTPKRFNPTITKLCDFSSDAEYKDLFTNEHYSELKSIVK